MRQAPPSREGLDRITTESVEIYRCRPPEGLWVPILVILAAVDNVILLGAYIEQALRDLKGGRAVGMSDIQVEDLKG